MQYLDTQDFRRLSAPQYQGFLDRACAVANGLNRLQRQCPEGITRQRMDYYLARHAAEDTMHAHYPVGSVFDYHGVPALVVKLAFQETKHQGLYLTAALKVGDSIEHITISQALALALIWRRYNLEDTPQ